jgi:Fe-S-cluster containining protein
MPTDGLLNIAVESQAAASSGFDCRDCGACCASFRVSFYWAEADAYGLPESLVEKLSPLYACMAGTDAAAPRCRALQGEVGSGVRCAVYNHRPSPCRELQAGDPQCARARHRHALPATIARAATEPQRMARNEPSAAD